MSYTPTNWSAGDTITAAKLNKMELGIEAANDPYPGYDLVIKAVHSNYINISHPGGLSLSDFEIVKGSISACVEKVANDEPVSGVLYFYNGHTNDYHIEFVAPLEFWDEGYQCFSFSNISTSGDNRIRRFSFGYDNGSLTSYDGYMFSFTATYVTYNS